MCLAIPGIIKSFSDTDENLALCDFIGLEREINVQLLKDEIDVGDYVIVHVGYAIQKLDMEDALETIKTWKELGEFQKELENELGF
ncbi:MAG: HypC/HybG/HupF family hydrogenase formation chaperone [Candidatus Hodarchaeales archaeon]|jgi:hydrogenase expression/formation protein HypC